MQAITLLPYRSIVSHLLRVIKHVRGFASQVRCCYSRSPLGRIAVHKVAKKERGDAETRCRLSGCVAPKTAACRVHFSTSARHISNASIYLSASLSCYPPRFCIPRKLLFSAPLCFSWRKTRGGTVFATCVLTLCVTVAQGTGRRDRGHDATGGPSRGEGGERLDDRRLVCVVFVVRRAFYIHQQVGNTTIERC